MVLQLQIPCVNIISFFRKFLNRILSVLVGFLLIAGYQIWNSRSSNKKSNSRYAKNPSRYKQTKAGLAQLERETKELERQIKSMGADLDLSGLGLDKGAQFENLYKEMMKNKKKN